MKENTGRKQSVIDTDLHRLFDLGVFLKGVEGVLEIIGSAGLFSSNTRIMEKIIKYVTQGELTEHPRDNLTKVIFYVFHRVTAGSIHFVAAILLVSGIINLILVFGIMKKDIWAYRGAMFVLALLILYQVYRMFYYGSTFLVVSMIYDAAIGLLVAREYRRMINSKPKSGSTPYVV